MPGDNLSPTSISKKSVKLKQENKAVEVKLLWNKHEIRGFSLLEDVMSSVSKIALSETCVVSSSCNVPQTASLNLPAYKIPGYKAIYL